VIPTLSQWIEELPKYPQGKRALRAGNDFCCLGVLAHLAGATWQESTVPVAPVGACDAELPQELGGNIRATDYPIALVGSVLGQAGLHSSEGAKVCRTLAGANDQGVSFARIGQSLRALAENPSCEDYEELLEKELWPES
jgi:hypothetical protein